MPAPTARAIRPRPVAARQIAGARRFNRFYTRKIGVLEEGLVDTPFTLAEARVLYELSRRATTTSVALCRDLGLDAGYLSRILTRLARQGLVARTRSPEDGRERPIALTARGRKAFAGLNRATETQIAAMLEPLAPGARHDLVAAMERIEHLLDGPAARSAAEVVLRPPRAGDLGWVIHRHGALYAEEHGFDASFEHLVASIVAQFAAQFDPAREACWIAEYAGEVVGSVFLVRESDAVGRLRLLYVEPAARGLGIGVKLVAACIDQARAFGYRRLTLWTQGSLIAARRIYQAAGFVLVEERPHRAFGQDLVEQDWMLEL
jgi:DNA-binding MarR family transcriptional regulator/N-acetylglutamate synthase-like GNAT family acetyltransferase